MPSPGAVRNDAPPLLVTELMPPADVSRMPEIAQASSPPAAGASVWENPTWSREDRPVPGAHTVRADLASSATVQPIARASEPGIPVLCYHHVFADGGDMDGFNIRPERFEEQLRYLNEQGYQSIRQEQLIAYMLGRTVTLPAKPILITFDDGSLSNYTEVAPLLARYDFNAVLFLYPTIISASRSRYMNWRQVQELVRSGRFEVASHTLWHPMLPAMDRRGIRDQLERSKRILEANLNTTVRMIAYPFGVYDRRVIEEARAVGYELGFTIQPGGNRSGDEPLTMNRYMVTSGHSLQVFASSLRLQSPNQLRIEPSDGASVRAGQSIRLTLGGVRPDSVRLSVAGRAVRLTEGDGTFSGAIPAFSSTRGYLPVVIRATDAGGAHLYQEFLYLDGARFTGN